ncbi:hypothetical protein DPMN_048305 [Dreissena polymorpha]|uniref:Uncharacterized protein n=1 Tax=Dreissena polymorpha TaxID=45954 RepID=A0A9D4I010_DREPO|nr:hypothetical protein DPMN_048305 [Dreissena polymorpha]
MGCSPGTSQSNSFRVVVSSGISPSYQQSRNASSISSCISFPVTSSRLLCDGVNRQHIGGGLHSGTGGNTLSISVSGNQEITCFLQNTQHFCAGQIHTRSPQRPGGWVVSQSPDTSIGMDTSSRSDQPDLFQVRLSSGRSICDYNNRLPLYVSPVYDPAAWAIDALSFVWDQLEAYAYPPPILIPQILAKIRVSSCRILLIPPGGPGDLGSTIFSVSCTIIPGNFLTDQIFYLKAADYMRIQ